MFPAPIPFAAITNGKTTNAPAQCTGAFKTNCITSQATAISKILQVIGIFSFQVNVTPSIPEFGFGLKWQ
jgi:hypothetical protein